MKAMIVQIVVGCVVGAVLLTIPTKANGEVAGATKTLGPTVSHGVPGRSGLQSQARSVAPHGVPHASRAGSGVEAHAAASRPAVESVDEPLSQVQRATTTTWYVREAGSHGNGQSWNEPFADLQFALEAAGNGDYIYVAVGEYSPSVQFDGGSYHDPNTKTFQITQDNLHIYGGFMEAWPHHSMRTRKPNYPVPSSTGFPLGALATALDGRDEIYTIVSIGGSLGRPTGVIIDGFTIARGNGDVDPPLDAPGGMHVNGDYAPGPRSGAIIRNCVFAGNTARFAGAMYTAYSDTQVIDCAFEGNSAIGDSGYPRGFGGAVFADWLSNLSFTRCLFSKNTAHANESGGAVFVRPDATISFRQCVFDGNTAGWGGGIYFDDVASGRVEGCIFKNNRADAHTGGAMVVGAAPVTVVNSLFHHNQADRGGAINEYYEVPGPSSTYTNCTIAHNHALSEGGGVNAWQATPTFANCIVYFNTRGGIGNPQISVEPFPEYQATVNYSDVEGGWAGPGIGSIDSNPLFVDPTNGDYRLPTGDPPFPVSNAPRLTQAIDSADLASYAVAFLPGSPSLTDVYGNARVLEYSDWGQSALLDMGAAEAFWIDCNGSQISDQCELACSLGGGTCGVHPTCGTLLTGCQDILAGLLDYCAACNSGKCQPADANCADCDGNGNLDSCDIQANGSLDIIPKGGDGILDSCNCTGGTGLGFTGAVAAVPLNWSDGGIWFTGVVPNNDGQTYDVSISDVTTDVRVDTDVIIDSLSVEDGATVRVDGATVGDLTVVEAGGIRNTGKIYVASNRLVTVSAEMAVGPDGIYEKDPGAGGTTSASLTVGSLSIARGSLDDGTSGGSVILVDTMSLISAGDVVLEGEPAAASAVASSRRGIILPPKLGVYGDASVSIDGNLLIASLVTVDATGATGAGPVVTLSGNFINKSTTPEDFNWTGGVLILNGSSPQTLEVAGQDLGDTEEGFDTGTDTNFSINKLEVAADSDVLLVNFYPNTTESVGSCNEALYVRELILRAGSTLTLANAKLYAQTITNEGGTIADGTCGGFSCPLADIPTAEVPNVPKNRYISVVGGNPGMSTALRVTFVSLPSPFDDWNGEKFFVGQPVQACENSGQGLSVSECGLAGTLPQNWFWAAPLECDPPTVFYTDWSTYDVVHLYHEGIVPGGIYNVNAIDIACATDLESNYSLALPMYPSAWGDVCGPGQVGACTDPPDGTVDVQNDVLGVLDKFANVNALEKTRADIAPQAPDLLVDVFTDVLYCLDAFTGAPFPFTPGADPCPPQPSRRGD